MLAVLIDAIRGLTAVRDAANVRIRAHRAWVRDRAWVQSEDESTPFSFVSICHALGLDAGYVRRCVLQSENTSRPLRVRRYAASVEETWMRLQRENACELRPISARDVARRHSADLKVAAAS